MSDPVLMDQQDGLLELLHRGRERYLDCSKLTLEEAECLGGVIATIARDIGFWLGDLSRYSEARWPDTHHQAWPVFASPGQLSRNAGVCRAYPREEDRKHHCSFSQYMQVSGKPDRQALLAEMIDKGQTTDESRKADSGRSGDGKRWLLAVDCNYFLHRFWHSGAGVEAASGVSTWIGRTVERLKQKGLTDVACCFDDRENHRKELTKDWDDKYKDRPPKDQELSNQLHLVRELLSKSGFACISIEGMEADDLMASYAVQFDGRVTLLTQDKDQRQCLSEKCNILLDVEWKQDDTSGDMLPVYQWLTAKTHTEKTGIPPERWTDYQCLMGDNVDGIRGVEGVGEKGAADLVKEYGTVEAVIEAAKKEDEYIKEKKRKALIEFEGKLDVTLQLVTLRDDLNIPSNTRLT